MYVVVKLRAVCAHSLPSHLQSKKPNFDATHELEELLLEDNVSLDDTADLLYR